MSEDMAGGESAMIFRSSLLCLKNPYQSAKKAKVSRVRHHV